MFHLLSLLWACVSRECVSAFNLTHPRSLLGMSWCLMSSSQKLKDRKAKACGVKRHRSFQSAGSQLEDTGLKSGGRHSDSGRRPVSGPLCSEVAVRKQSIAPGRRGSFCTHSCWVEGQADEGGEGGGCVLLVHVFSRWGDSLLLCCLPGIFLLISFGEFNMLTWRTMNKSAKLSDGIPAGISLAEGTESKT